MNTYFRRFVLASGFTNLADGIATVAWAWLASLLTRDPLLIASVPIALRLPWFLFAIPAGIITDRTKPVYAAWVDMEELAAEDDQVVGTADVGTSWGAVTLNLETPLEPGRHRVHLDFAKKGDVRAQVDSVWFQADAASTAPTATPRVEGTALNAPSDRTYAYHLVPPTDAALVFVPAGAATFVVEAQSDTTGPTELAPARSVVEIFCKRPTRALERVTRASGTGLPSGSTTCAGTRKAGTRARLTRMLGATFSSGIEAYSRGGEFGSLASRST